MTKKPKIEPEKFRLIIKTKNQIRIIQIPQKPNGKRGKLTGGKETYLMAIDAFTTQFIDKKHLLDYIRTNSLVTIPNINNQNIQLEIQYTGKTPYSGNLSILYQDQKQLISFINQNAIRETFEPEHPAVKKFKETIIKYWTTGLSQTEYQMFMTDHQNNYFGLDLIRTMERIKKEKLIDKVKDPSVYIGPLSHYHNLRGYFTTIDILEQILQEITKKKIWSYQEKNEYENENRLKLKILNIPEEKTQPTNPQIPHQIVQINNPNQKQNTK